MAACGPGRQEDTEHLGKELASKQARLTALGTQLEAETVAISKVQAELATLALKVNGELVQLVADEARRREEAEAARARADAERQRQALARIAEKQRQEVARVAEQQRQELVARRAADTARATADARANVIASQPRTVASVAPRTDAPGSQANAFPRVDADELQPGDLVFFNVDLGHMGMYIGNDQIVQAPRSGDVVKISSLNRGNVVVAVRPG